MNQSFLNEAGWIAPLCLQIIVDRGVQYVGGGGALD